MHTAEPAAATECPVCSVPIGSEQRCARCDWTLRTGHVLGAPTAAQQVAFDEQMRAAQRVHDLRCAARAAGFPWQGDEERLARLVRFVRGGPPSPGELAEAKSLPANAFPENGRHKPDGPGSSVLVDADGITATRFEQGPDGVYELAETEQWSWRELLPTLPTDVEEQRFVLAGGAGMSPAAATDALSSTLHRVTAAGPLLAIDNSVPHWPIAAQASAMLSARHPGVPATTSCGAAPVHAWRLRGRISAFTATSDDNVLVATGTADGTVRIGSITARRHVERAVHARRITTLDIMAGGKAVVSGGQEGAVMVWRTSPDDKVRVLATHEGWVNAVRVAGDLVFSLGDDGRLRRSVLTAGSDLPDDVFPLNVSWAASTALATSADAHCVAFGGTDGKVQLRDGTTGRQRGTVSVGSAIRSLAMDAGGELLAVAAEDNSLLIYDLTRTTQLAQLRLSNGPATCVHVAANGSVVFGDEQGWVGLWRRASPESAAVLGRHPDSVVGVAVGRTGSVISAGRDGLVRVWQEA